MVWLDIITLGQTPTMSIFWLARDNEFNGRSRMIGVHNSINIAFVVVALLDISPWDICQPWLDSGWLGTTSYIDNRFEASLDNLRGLVEEYKSAFMVIVTGDGVLE